MNRRWMLCAALIAACSDNPTPQVAPDCQSATDCPGADTDCSTRACVEGKCDPTLAPAGTAIAAQTAGDCQDIVCDGSGKTMSATDDTDAPSADDTCVTRTCSSGAIVEAVAPIGTACGTGLECDGGGTCVHCTVEAECPGSDTDCQVRTCTFGACGISFFAAGTVRSAAHQIAGDCAKATCDGAGGSGAPVVDNTDVPKDNNTCTSDVCTAGVPSNPDVPARTACGSGNLCDGEGACVQCTLASDCPGVTTDCQTVACHSGACGFDFTASGTAVNAQVPGDCVQQQCDGAGHVVPATDTTDVPNDNNDCTIDVCTGSTPSHTNAAIHTQCGGASSTLECDGAGTCVGCVDETECPGHDDECEQRHCVGGSCSKTDAPSGTPLTAAHQVAGDCNLAVCDGAGNTIPEVDDADVPIDNETCTTDVCLNGTPSNPAVTAETACSEGTGSRCNGTGKCVECITASECPGADSACRTRTCSGAGACGEIDPPAGLAPTGQTSGNCQDVVCDGTGGSSSAEDDADVPVDASACTSNLCTAGVPSNPNAPDGTSCDASGDVCDAIHGVGTCLPALTGAGGQQWKSLGWTGGVPCIDGLRFSVNGLDLYGCSPTAGAFAAVKTTGVLGPFVVSNTGLDNTVGFSIGVHSTVDNVTLFNAVPSGTTHNFAQSNNSGASWSPLTIADGNGVERPIVSARFQQMVGGLWLTYDRSANQALVLTGNGIATAAHTVGATPATGTPRAIVPGKAPPNDLWLAVFGQTVDGSAQCAVGIACTGGIFKSTNKAVTWTEADVGFAATDLPLVYSIIQDPAVATSQTMYAALQGGGQVYKTTDDGATWVQANVGLPPGALVNVIAVSDSPAVTLYAATNVGLFISTDGAATWTLAGFAGRNVLAVTLDPTNAASVFVGVDDDVGVYIPGP